MRNDETEMWRFETARFAVIWTISPSESCDLSWDETGETRFNLESGLWSAFDSKMSVELDGVEIAADYLGESIYEDPADFRDHIGINEIASKTKARKELSKAKSDYIKRIQYCQDKVQLDVWSHAAYIRNTQQARDSLRQARLNYERAMQSAGHCGSYFSDMVRNAISEARAYLTKTPNMRKAG